MKMGWLLVGAVFTLVQLVAQGESYEPLQIWRFEDIGTTNAIDISKVTVLNFYSDRGLAPIFSNVLDLDGFVSEDGEEEVIGRMDGAFYFARVTPIRLDVIFQSCNYFSVTGPGAVLIYRYGDAFTDRYGPFTQEDGVMLFQDAFGLSSRPLVSQLVGIWVAALEPENCEEWPLKFPANETNLRCGVQGENNALTKGRLDTAIKSLVEDKDSTDFRHISAPYMDMEGSTIPTEIGLLTQLTFLNFRGSTLKGTVPTEIGLLTDLEVLDLTATELNGCVAPSVASLMKERGGRQSRTFTYAAEIVANASTSFPITVSRFFGFNPYFDEQGNRGLKFWQNHTLASGEILWLELEENYTSPCTASLSINATGKILAMPMYYCFPSFHSAEICAGTGASACLLIEDDRTYQFDTDGPIIVTAHDGANFTNFTTPVFSMLFSDAMNSITNGTIVRMSIDSFVDGYSFREEHRGVFESAICGPIYSCGTTDAALSLCYFCSEWEHRSSNHLIIVGIMSGLIGPLVVALTFLYAPFMCAYSRLHLKMSIWFIQLVVFMWSARAGRVLPVTDVYMMYIGILPFESLGLQPYSLRRILYCNQLGEGFINLSLTAIAVGITYLLVMILPSLVLRPLGLLPWKVDWKRVAFDAYQVNHKVPETLEARWKGLRMHIRAMLSLGVLPLLLASLQDVQEFFVVRLDQAGMMEFMDEVIIPPRRYVQSLANSVLLAVLLMLAFLVLVGLFFGVSRVKFTGKISFGFDWFKTNLRTLSDSDRFMFLEFHQAGEVKFAVLVVILIRFVFLMVWVELEFGMTTFFLLVFALNVHFGNGETNGPRNQESKFLVNVRTKFGVGTIKIPLLFAGPILILSLITFLITVLHAFKFYQALWILPVITWVAVGVFCVQAWRYRAFYPDGVEKKENWVVISNRSMLFEDTMLPIPDIFAMDKSLIAMRKFHESLLKVIKLRRELVSSSKPIIMRNFLSKEENITVSVKVEQEESSTMKGRTIKVVRSTEFLEKVQDAWRKTKIIPPLHELELETLELHDEGLEFAFVSHKWYDNNNPDGPNGELAVAIYFALREGNDWDMVWTPPIWASYLPSWFQRKLYRKVLKPHRRLKLKEELGIDDVDLSWQKEWQTIHTPYLWIDCFCVDQTSPQTIAADIKGIPNVLAKANETVAFAYDLDSYAKSFWCCVECAFSSTRISDLTDFQTMIPELYISSTQIEKLPLQFQTFRNEDEIIQVIDSFAPYLTNNTEDLIQNNALILRMVALYNALATNANSHNDLQQNLHKRLPLFSTGNKPVSEAERFQFAE